MKKLLIALLFILLMGCDRSQSTEHTAVNTTVDTLLSEQTTQAPTTTSIISPQDYIDGIHISSYWYSVMDEDDKWGFIDLDGDIVIPFICDEATYFENGTAIVSINGLKGIINFLGNYMLVPQFDEIASLNNGQFYAANMDLEDSVVYNYLGHELFTIEGIDHYYDMDSDTILKYQIDSLYGLVSIEGNIITDCIFEQIRPFHNGVSAVQKDSLWGFINQDGDYIINPIYIQVTDLNNGIASVLDAWDTWKAVYIGDSTNLAFEQTSEIPFDFNEFGISLFVKDEKVGQIDIDGTIIVQALYTPKNDTIDMNSIFINAELELIFDPEGGILYSSSTSDILCFIEDAIIIQNKKTGLYSVIKISGDYIILPEEGYLYFKSDINGDFMIVEPLGATGDSYNLYDLKGVRANKDTIYGDNPSFNLQNKVYFNLAEMSRVITFEGYPMFEKEISICIFLEDVIIISDGENMGMVDYYGKVIIPMEYKSI